MAIAGPGPGLPTPSSIQAQLTSVQAAIAALESGAQSYTVGGRSVTKASILSLYQREEDLLRRLSRSTSAYVGGYNGMFGRGRVAGTGQS